MTGIHPVTREEVMAWLDGEVPAPRGDEIATHVAACADCGALAADLRLVSARVAVWTVEPAPADWQAGAHRASAPMASATTRRWPPRRVLIAAALAASITLAIVVPLTRQSSPTRQLSLTRRSVQLGERPGDLTYHDKLQGPATAVADRQVETLGYVSPRPGEPAATTAPQPSQPPMIARTASLSLTTERFDEVRSALERATVAEGGSIVSLSAGGEARRRTLNATVRVPAPRLDAALAAFRALGVVKQESLDTTDVTDSYRDLTVRIRNARIEEQRLVELLKVRTGTVKDVLDVEREIARVRSEAERMAAEAESMRNRVTFSLVRLAIAETYRAELVSTGELPVGLRLRNALVEGVRAARQSVLEVALELARTAPTLMVWALVVGPVAWVLVRRLRRAGAPRA